MKADSNFHSTLALGKDKNDSGASFTFGCGFSMFNDGCKYATNGNDEDKIRKFKLDKGPIQDEIALELLFNNLATFVSPLFKIMAPDAFANMTKYESIAGYCF